MSKELIAKQDLERIAMQEIRSFPGCEHVTEVEIEYQVIKCSRRIGLFTSSPVKVATWSGFSTRSTQRGSGYGVDVTCGQNPKDNYAAASWRPVMRTDLHQPG
jgi:hypothetical protein